MIKRSHIILYVADQQASTRFYASALNLSPSLVAPGMTEFTLPGGAILGLMPEAGARRLLEGIRDPALARGIPRCELYLMVSDPGIDHARAIAAGARELSGLARRDWGHIAAYSIDTDGHVLAFAAPAESEFEGPSA